MTNRDEVKDLDGGVYRQDPDKKGWTKQEPKKESTGNKITYRKRLEVYAEALEAYGVNTQLIVALEELSEAQKEICKMLRGDGNIYSLAAEVADATIMLEQVRQIFEINNEVCEAMDLKLERLQRRIRIAQRERAKRETCFG